MGMLSICQAQAKVFKAGVGFMTWEQPSSFYNRRSGLVSGLWRQDEDPGISEFGQLTLRPAACGVPLAPTELMP